MSTMQNPLSLAHVEAASICDGAACGKEAYPWWKMVKSSESKCGWECFPLHVWACWEESSSIDSIGPSFQDISMNFNDIFRCLTVCAFSVSRNVWMSLRMDFQLEREAVTGRLSSKPLDLFCWDQVWTLRPMPANQINQMFIEFPYKIYKPDELDTIPISPQWAPRLSKPHIHRRGTSP